MTREPNYAKATPITTTKLTLSLVCRHSTLTLILAGQATVGSPLRNYDLVYSRASGYTIRYYTYCMHLNAAYIASIWFIDTKWEYVNDWSECSATCGGGTQTRTLSCVYLDNIAAEGQCSDNAESESRDCNVDICRKLLIRNKITSTLQCVQLL